MVRLVDVPLDGGDANRAVADITAAITESATASQNTRTTQTTTQTRQSPDDPRFVGKSAAEIVEMYRNLESHSGRLASQLGEARNSVTQLILGKRENDLRAGNGIVEPAKILPTDLMVNPTEALDRYLTARANPEVSALRERLNQLEQQLQTTSFTLQHPKAETTTQDPAFAAWVRQTPLRARLAQSAANGNMQDADLLLKEWEHVQTQEEDPVTNTQNRAQALARTVTLESSNTSNESGTGRQQGKKVFRRSDLIALRQRDPDKYEDQAFQNEIIKAYVEGRVVD
jgi:hypothetical protein